MNYFFCDDILNWTRWEDSTRDTSMFLSAHPSLIITIFISLINTGHSRKGNFTLNFKKINCIWYKNCLKLLRLKSKRSSMFERSYEFRHSNLLYLNFFTLNQRVHVDQKISKVSAENWPRCVSIFRIKILALN